MRMAVRHDPALLVGLGVALLAVTSGYTAPGANEKAVRSDIQYIRCGVCEALAKNAHRQIKALRDEHKGPRRLSEIEILEVVEKIADPVAKEGEWITRIDLVEKGNQLALVEQAAPGACGMECKTIAKAAEEILGDNDTDLGEVLWKGDSGRLAVTKWLCTVATDACTRKVPPLPASRRKGPAFQEIDEQELNMQRMMASMQGSGMKGSVYSRDEAAKMASGGAMGGGDDEDDDDDDDDEDDDDVASSPLPRSMGAVRRSVMHAGQAALERAAPLVEKAMPVLATAGRSISSVFNAVAARVSPPAQHRPPHVEL